MYARSTTMQVRPSDIDAAIDFVRDTVMPFGAELSGWMGLSMLVDRAMGRCILTTSWESAAALQMSADQVAPMRDRMLEMATGPARVEEWEIAVLHRTHRTRPGACARVAWLKTDPDRLGAAVETYRDQFLSEMEMLDGFCSASLLCNPASGRAVSCVTYDNAELMARTRDQAATLRADAMRRAAADLIDSCEFELAHAHLRVPELA